MIRYADDFVILCRTEAEAREALGEVQAWMAAAGLTLHLGKTRIVDAAVKGGFEFLGWHFERELIGLRENFFVCRRAFVRFIELPTPGAHLPVKSNGPLIGFACF